MVHHAKLKKSPKKAKQRRIVSKPTPQMDLSVLGNRPILLVFVVFFLLMYSPRIVEHGSFAYEIARSLVWDGDIQFANERSQMTQFCVDPHTLDQFDEDLGTGFVQNPSGFGSPMTILPILYAVRFIELFFHHIWHIDADFGIMSSFASLSYSLVTVLLGALSLLFMVKSCRHFGSPFSAQIAVMVVVFSSSFLSTTLLLPGYIETVALFWTSLFVMLLLNNYFEQGAAPSKKMLLLTGFSLGMAICSEWSLISLIVLVLVLSGRNKSLFRSIQELQIVLVFFFLGLFIGLSPQLIANKIILGHYVHYSIDGDAASVIRSIFHPRLGLIFQFPLIIFAVSGIMTILRHDKRISFISLFLVLLHILMNGLKSGEIQPDFGHRHLVMILPLLAFGLTFFLDNLLKKRTITEIQALLMGALVLFWTFSQMLITIQLGNKAIMAMKSWEFLKILFLNIFHNLAGLMSSSFFFHSLSPRGSGGLFRVLLFGSLIVTFVVILYIFEWIAVKKSVEKIAYLAGGTTMAAVLVIDLILIIGSWTATIQYDGVLPCPGEPIHCVKRVYPPWSSFEAGSDLLSIKKSERLKVTHPQSFSKNRLFDTVTLSSSVFELCGADTTGAFRVEPPLVARTVQFVFDSQDVKVSHSARQPLTFTINLNSEGPDSMSFRFPHMENQPGNEDVLVEPLSKVTGRSLVTISLKKPVLLKSISFMFPEEVISPEPIIRVYGCSIIPEK